MFKRRNEHFDSISDAGDEVSAVLRDTGNLARNVAYLIQCDNDREDHEFKNDASERFSGDIPSWAWAAHFVDYCLYVGATTDLHNRFREHCFSNEHGALFTGLFPPERIVAVSEFSTPSSPFNAESKLASKAEEGFREQYDIDDDAEIFVYHA